MGKQKSSVLTFLKNNGKKIIKKERYKYEPIRTKQQKKIIIQKKKVFKTKWFERNKEIRYIAHKHENIIDTMSVNGRTDRT